MVDAIRATAPEQSVAARDQGRQSTLLLCQGALWAVAAPFLASRVLLLAITVTAATVRHISPVDIWNQWDAKWYVGIALHGYRWSVHAKPSLAFFPLYPLALHTMAATGLPTVLSGILLSNMFFAGALFYLYLLASDQFGDVIAKRSLWLLALFPTALFTFAPYSEGLFLLCAVGTFYHARRQQALRAGLWMAAAILCRSSAIALILPTLVLLGLPTVRRWFLALTPPVVAVAAYAIYLHVQTIGLGSLLTAQHAWHRSLTVPWTGFVASLEALVRYSGTQPAWALEDMLQLTVGLAFLALTAFAWRWLDASYRAYCVGFWLLVLCTPEWLDHYYAPFSSLDRFVLVLFPLAMWVSWRVRPVWFRTIALTSAALLSVATADFLAGGWVG